MINKEKKGDFYSCSNEGITLIALVVTIVVLLILAGVTINMLFSDSGIIKKAQEAKDVTEKAVQNDLDAIKQAGEMVNDALNGNLGNPPTANELKPADKGKKVEGSNATYTDENGKTAIIPVGFCVVKDGTEDPKPNNVTEGLVISDVANDDLDNSDKGNQFVWIPVENYNDFHLIEGYKGSLQTDLSEESNPSREAGSSKTAKLPGKPNETNSILGTDESVAMYDSVRMNKGFYIARFEMGIPNTTVSTETNDENKQTQDGTVKPVSKKGVGVWNFISWAKIMEPGASDGHPGNDNADGAVKVARSMYTKSSTCGATSTLCYGVQWDATLKFIEPNYGEYNADKTDYNNIASDNFVKNSSEKGNYAKENGSGSIAVTGSDLAYQQKHVYDLAGNVFEWTMEAAATSCRVRRGGGFTGDGSSVPASIRIHGAPVVEFPLLGARVTLYL